MPEYARPRGSPWKVELLIVVLIVLAVAGLMVPVIWRTYQVSQTVRCQQQLTELFGAVQTYARSFNGYAPGGPGWRGQLRAFLSPAEGAEDADPSRIWQCPAGGTYIGNATVFGPNRKPLPELGFQHDVGILADGSADAEPAGLGDFRLVAWRHRGSANVIFLDGRVQLVTRNKAPWVGRHWDHPQ